MYCRIKNYPINRVLPVIVDEPRKELQYKCKKKGINYKALVSSDFDGILVKMDSLRYQTFKVSGCVCVSCGLKASHFGLEALKHDTKNGGPYHFNLYGWKDGKEMMFTKDHIHPKSKGGKDIIENMQTMCSECNCEKGNKI